MTATELQDEIFKSIEMERKRQDEKWGAQVLILNSKAEKDKPMTKKPNKKKQTNMRLSDRGNANLLALRELLGGPIGPAKPRETIEWAIEQAILIAQKEAGKVRTKGST